MAHELDFNEKTGKHSYFGVKQDAWHKLGHTLEDAPDFDNAMQLAGFGFDTIARPLTYTDPFLGPVQVEGWKAIIREDRGSILHVAQDSYSIVQYREAFEPIIPLIDSGVLKLETGGTLDEGRRAWIMGRLSFDNTLVSSVFKDEMVPYFLLCSSHDQTQAIEGGLSVTRVVCANTLAIARMSNNLFKTRHKGNARERNLVKVETFFAEVSAKYEGLANQFQLLKDKILTVQAFTKLMDVISPLPSVTKPEDMGTRGYVNAESRRDAFQYKWENGAGHNGDHSAWEAYNGVVEVVDHNENLFRINKGGNRIEQMMMGGRLEQYKDKAFEACLALCK